VPHIDVRAPASTDINYPVGKRWIYTNNSTYELLGLTSFNGVTNANWVLLSGSAGTLSQLTGTTGTATPTAGSIQIAGTTNEITTAAAGSTVTLSIPTSFIAPGSIAAASGNITATSGNFVASAAGDGFVFNSSATAGTTTATLNGRSGQITITTPSIAAGATFTFTITNSAITASTTQILYGLTGGTTGAAVTIQSVANSASQSIVVVQNATAVTDSTASLVLTFLVIN
jgi:hypothetical protein